MWMTESKEKQDQICEYIHEKFILMHQSDIIPLE